MLNYKVTRKNFIQAFDLNSKNNIFNKIVRFCIGILYVFMVIAIIMLTVAVLMGEYDDNYFSVFRNIILMICTPFFYFYIRFQRAQINMKSPDDCLGDRSLEIFPFGLKLKHGNVYESIEYSSLKEVKFNKKIILILTNTYIFEIVPASAFSNREDMHKFINDLILNIEKSKNLHIGKEQYV